MLETFLNSSRFGYVLNTIPFAATPLQIIMLFVNFGLIRIKSICIYIGFWFGQVLSYYFMLSICDVVLVPFLQLFKDRYIGIIIADDIGRLVLFESMNWGMFITQKNQVR